MHAEDAARKSASAIGTLPAGFMLDGATYKRGAALGFDGIDFYTAGRGGALGDVDGTVVAAAFVFFNPASVVEGWDRARKVMAPARSMVEFMAVEAAWAHAHMPDEVDYGRLSELAGRIIDAASPAGVPLFAAWAAVAVPLDPRESALHRLNVLRELRGGLHGVSVIGCGLEPLEAVMVKAPFMATIFGWAEPYPDPTESAATWKLAEAATNRAMARSFAALGAAELDEFVELADAAYRGVS